MLLAFPALIGLGVPSITANATCTVALWPGSVASFVGYRSEVAGVRAWLRYFLVPSIAGGLLGGFLLTITSQQRFDQIVPFLVLFATLLFVLNRPVLDFFRNRVGRDPAHPVNPETQPPPRAFLIFHFLVAIYGGYFGGGAGMLMLAAFGLMGLTNIHQMNGLKNFCGITFNFVAMAAFAVRGLVDWPVAGNMAVGAALGGFAASGLAQRVPQAWVRGAVSVIGFSSGAWLLFHRR